MCQVAVSSYSFHRLVKDGTAALTDTPSMARAVGADGIEFALGGSLSPPLNQEMARELSRAAGDAGLSVTGVCIGAELLRGTADERERALGAVLRQLDAAALLGVARFRHDATLGPSDGDLSNAAFENALPILSIACRRIAQHASAIGIRSSIENHGRFLQHAERVARLIEEVAHSAFGLTLDIGNSLFAAQDPVAAAERLAPFAITVHVKDFEIHQLAAARPAGEGMWETYAGGHFVRGSVIGEGDLDVRACLSAIQRASFDGPFVVEFEGPFGDPRDAARRGIECTRRLLREFEDN